MSKSSQIVASFVYRRRQRDVAVACDEEAQDDTLQSLPDSCDVDEHYSEPSQVVDSHLSIPTEQSSSSDEESTSQSRIATYTRVPLDGERSEVKGTLLPHLDIPESVSNTIEEDTAPFHCQKTWSPSNNPLSPPYVRQSQSCPTSPMASNYQSVDALFYETQAQVSHQGSDHAELQMMDLRQGTKI